MSSRATTFTEISPSEFFYRNRDLAGFSNPARALYSAARELVENSLDACEAAEKLPEIEVVVEAVSQSDSDPKHYRLRISDNGSGIPEEHIPLAFGRVFYGSKFRLKQARGMFGLGGTMAILYGQITTNVPVKIFSSADGRVSHEYVLMINIQENSPVVLNKMARPSDRTGTVVEVTLLGDYSRSAQKLQEYFKQTAMVNPSANITFRDPLGNLFNFRRATNDLPRKPKETRPHPHGVDVETIRRLIRPEKKRLIDLGFDGIKDRIRRELGLGKKDLAALQSIFTDGQSSDSSNDPASVSVEKILQRQSDPGEGQSKASSLKPKVEILSRRWANLTKSLKTFLAIYLQTRMEARRAAYVMESDVDFVNQQIRVQGVAEPFRLFPVEPLHAHLLEEAGGDPLLKFTTRNFHRVGEHTARKFITFARFEPSRRIRTLSNEEIVAFVDALHRFGEFLAPDADCLSPLGGELLSAGIEKELQPEFHTVVERSPSAYSGFPYIVEIGLAYGGKVLQQGLKLFRFANRIPLLYDEANDVSWRVLSEEIDWKRYRIPQDAPLAVITHLCSTKVPYKTVGKEYLADRPEVERDLKNGIREALRKLSIYLSKKGNMEMVRKRLNIYGRYLPLISRFATRLAEARRPPRYRSLLGKEEGEVQAPKEPMAEGEAGMPELEEKELTVQMTVEESLPTPGKAEQKTLEEFA